MKKSLVTAAVFCLGLLLAYAQPLGQLPNLPKPNDTLQVLTYKAALVANGGLAIPAHDAQVITYSGSNATETIYKVGGKNGRTVGVLTQEFSGSNVTSRAITVQ